jgi:hypothetical protein
VCLKKLADRSGSSSCTAPLHRTYTIVSAVASFEALESVLLLFYIDVIKYNIFCQVFDLSIHVTAHLLAEDAVRNLQFFGKIRDE